MNVAYVSLHADIIGGGEHSLMELIAHLPDSIHPELIVPEEGALSRLAEGMGIPVHYLPMPKIGFKSIPALWQWRRWLKFHSFNILHANQSRAAFYAGCAALGTKAKVVFHCRIAERDPCLDSMLMRLSDAIVCNSQAVARRFENFVGKLQVIYNGVTKHEEPLEKVSPLPEGGRLILFVGRLSAEKQPQLALQLFEQLAGKFDDLHFALVGGDDPYDPAFSEALKESISNSRFASRIYMPGAVDSVAAWYRQAEILVLTSRHEGFGRVLVEAMAHAVPVVAFSVGGVCEVVEHGVQGLLVEAGNLNGLVESCESILADSDQYRNMSEAGLIRAKEFSVKQHVDQVCEFYQELTSDSIV